MIEWGPIIGAGIGAAASTGNSFISSWLGNSSSKRAQKRAYNYWKSSLKDGPLLTRQGLEAAGYNPLLALGSVGGQQFSANSAPSFAPVGDSVGSAREGSRLGYEIVKGIKLENERKELENANLSSDLDTKELQRLNMEANRSLIESQDNRISFAYGRDIADAITAIAGTGASLYSAKAMADVARQNAHTNARNATANERRLDSHTSEVYYDKKGKVKGTVERQSFSHGVPAVDSSANPKTKPNAAGSVGSSAKSVGSAVKSVARSILENPLLFPLILTGTAMYEYGTPEGRQRQGAHYRRNWESNRYFSPLR